MKTRQQMQSVQDLFITGPLDNSPASSSSLSFYSNL